MIRVRKIYNTDPQEAITTLTVSNVNVFGQHRGLIVCVFSYDNTTCDTPSSVVWNSQNLTMAVQAVATDTLSKCSIWYLEAPGQLMSDVTVTWPSSQTAGHAYAILLNDMAQSTSTDGTGTDANSSNNQVEPAITTGTDGSLVIQVTGFISRGTTTQTGVTYSSGQTGLSVVPSTDWSAIAYEIIPTAGANNFITTATVSGASLDKNESALCAFKQSLGPNTRGNTAYLGGPGYY